MSWLISQAMMKNYGNLPSLRVLVEEYLGDNFSDGEPSVPLSGSSTPQAYCAPDKMTAFSRLSRFGMTFKPLTESRGEELLTLYLEDFRVKTLAAPEKELESKEKEAECGQSSQELLARYDPSTSLWRTAQCSLFEDLEQCLETWPRWGSMQSGACYQQPLLVQTTNERESGYWLTPATVNIPIRSEESMQKRFAYRKNIGRNGVGAGCLAEQVEWSGMGSPVGYVTKKNWPTPTSRDHNGAYKTGALIRKDGKSREFDALPNAVLNGMGAETATGQLNPTWVEWLMGWPLGWTDLKPLEMDKSLCVQQQPLNYLKRD